MSILRLFLVFMFSLFLCGCDASSARELTPQAKSRYFISTAAYELLSLKHSGQPYDSNILWMKMDELYHELIRRGRDDRDWFIEEMWISKPSDECKRIVVVAKVVMNSNTHWMISSAEDNIISQVKMISHPEDSLFDDLMQVDIVNGSGGR